MNFEQISTSFEQVLEAVHKRRHTPKEGGGVCRHDVVFQVENTFYHMTSSVNSIWTIQSNFKRAQLNFSKFQVFESPTNFERNSQEFLNLNKLWTKHFVILLFSNYVLQFKKWENSWEFLKIKLANSKCFSLREHKTIAPKKRLNQKEKQKFVHCITWVPSELKVLLQPWSLKLSRMFSFNYIV